MSHEALGDASLLNSIRDELPAEVLLGEQTIVARAQNSKISGTIVSVPGPRFLMVNLRELGRAATLPIAPHERAP